MIENFNVTGMSCAACQANVTKAVQKLEGVNSVDVSLLGNSMKVDYDSNQVSAQEIISSVEKIGYGASSKTEKKEENSLRKEWNQRQERIEKERKEAKFRLILSVILMIPLMYIAMAEMMSWPLPSALSGMENMMVNTLLQFILASIIMLIQKHFYIDGWKGLIHRAPNMDSLVAIGSSASYIYAIAMTFIMAQTMGAGNMEKAHMAAHALYFDSAAMIVTLVSIGKYLESKSKAKTGDALGQLMDLTPKNAIVLRDGKELSISSDQVQKGDTLVVKPGQRIPVDGKVVSGIGYVDQSALTGEGIPVEKQVGDSVLSASMNKNGTFQFVAEKVGDDTTLAQIVRLVDEAGTSKAEIARIADRVAGFFVPVVMGISLLTFLGWLLAHASFQTALNNAISVLVISCPCALGLATPMAIMVGTEKAAKYGILLKNAQSLENLHKIDTIVLDKTGTITSGKPTVQDVLSYTMEKDAFIELAANLERASQHPLAQAIVENASGKIKEVEAFEDLPGRGICATFNQKIYYAGNQRLMEEKGIGISSQVKEDSERLAEQGKTPMFFAYEGKVIGIIAVADTIRDTSKKAIQAFKNKGIHVVMLTGDHQRTAKAMARNLAIDEVISEVLPSDKEGEIRRLQSQGRFVAMVGDGINDAPALVRADIGIAIGQGTDIAMDSAEVVLMKNSLSDVNTAIELSSAVIRNIKQNLFWAFFYNIIGIPLAMGILEPLTGWTMSPMYGAAAMSLSSVFVCSNAWRLSFFHPKEIKEEAQVNETIVVEKRPSIKVKVQIEGMMCNHCCATVDHAIRKVAGVNDVKVQLESATAFITMDEKTSKIAIKQAIVDAGYIPSEIEREEEEMRLFGKKEKEEIKVPDMMCKHCVAHVTEALEKTEGISNVKVDLESKVASFTGNRKKAFEAIKEAGYQPEQ